MPLIPMAPSWEFDRRGVFSAAIGPMELYMLGLITSHALNSDGTLKWEFDRGSSTPSVNGRWHLKVGLGMASYTINATYAKKWEFEREGGIFPHGSDGVYIGSVTKYTL